MKFTLMYKLVAAILLGNVVGGRMANTPHYNWLAAVRYGQRPFCFYKSCQ